MAPSSSLLVRQHMVRIIVMFLYFVTIINSCQLKV